jgi:hypothetical protein
MRSYQATTRSLKRRFFWQCCSWCSNLWWPAEFFPHTCIVHVFPVKEESFVFLFRGKCRCVNVVVYMDFAVSCIPCKLWSWSSDMWRKWFLLLRTEQLHGFQLATYSPPSQNICRFRFFRTTLIKYILKNINIYSI